MSLDIERPDTSTGQPSGRAGAPSAPTWYDDRSQIVSGPAVATPPPGKSARSGRGRRLTELSAVALLAAVLSTGGTLAATQLWSSSSNPPSATTNSPSLGRGSDTADVAPVVQANAAAPNWTATAAAVSPSVVSITARSASGEGQGSGVVIDKTGYVLTNNHVVAGAQQLTVTLHDGVTYAATVKGTDPSTDLAVVQLTNPPADLEPIAFGDSSKLAVGDQVMAVGNPLGLSGTVTTGIISALDRPVRTEQAGESQQQSPFGGQQQQSSSEPVVTNAIQTSAAINPGNSGGALVNSAGQLIGINSAIASLGSSSSGQSGNIGIGFAIPVNEARDIATQLIQHGAAQHAYLGVTPVDGTATEGSTTRAGAQIQNVGAATPAAAAGLKVGDVVIAVGDQRIESADALVGTIRASQTGQDVTLTVLRDGQQVTLRATLAAKPTSTN